MEKHLVFKRSFINRLGFALLLGSQLFYSAQAHADCPMGVSTPSPLVCNSYEFGMPVNITNPTGNPSLTVMDGHVGIGTLSPAARLDTVYGIPSGDSADNFVAVRSSATVNTASNYTGSISGVQGRVSTGTSQSGTIGSVVGASGNVYHQGTGTLTYTSGVSAGINNTSTGIITNAYGVSVLSPVNSGGGTINNYYGIYVDTPTAATNNFSIYSNGGLNFFGGRVGIGTNAPTSDLDVVGTIRTDTICDRTGANCKTVADGWGSGGSGSGTVTSVATGTGLIGGPITTSGTLSVDVGTTANKIVQLDSNARLPSVSGEYLVNVNATKLAGKNVNVLLAPPGTYLGSDGTNWISKAIAISEVTFLSTQLANKIDASNMPANCSANQTLTFSSPTGTWSCSNIVVTAASLGSQTANTVLAAPNGSNGTPAFRQLATADLPSSVVNSLWTSSGSDINRPTGNVGIGVSNPSSKLTVAGEVRSNSGGFRFPDGSLQTTAFTNSSRPLAQVLQYTATSAPGNTWTKISLVTPMAPPMGWNDILFDVLLDQTNSRLIPQRAGYYRAHFNVQVSVVGSGGGSTLTAAIYINGSARNVTTHLINYQQLFTQTLQVEGIVYLDGASDYVEGFVHYNGPSTSTINAGPSATYLSLEFIR